MRLFFNSNPIKTIVSSSLFRSHPSDSWWSCKSLYNRCCINFDHKRLTARTATMATTSKLSSMGVVAENEAGIARRFWIKFRKESILAMCTPSVVCLASGNLNLETFRHYIAQDVHFLKSFAQAYELAEECADDDDAKVAISDLRKSVLEELKIHDSFVKSYAAMKAREYLKPAIHETMVKMIPLPLLAISIDQTSIPIHKTKQVGICPPGSNQVLVEGGSP